MGGWIMNDGNYEYLNGKMDNEILKYEYLIGRMDNE